LNDIASALDNAMRDYYKAAHAEKAAWGSSDGSDYAKALYAAGWPKDVRPYQARHSVALELGERGIDLGDVQGWLGHRQLSTTRKHYAPVLASGLKQASEMLAGRFKKWEPLAEIDEDGRQDATEHATERVH
jgi:integrase